MEHLAVGILGFLLGVGGYTIGAVLANALGFGRNLFPFLILAIFATIGSLCLQVIVTTAGAA